MSLPSIREYLPEHASFFTKIAGQEKAPIEHPYTHMAKTVGAGLLGFTGGMAAGAGTLMLAEKLTGRKISKMAPEELKYVIPAAALAGTAAAKLYDKWKKDELAELQRAWTSRHNKPQG